MNRLIYDLSILWDLSRIQLAQILPYWILGSVFGSLISVYLREPVRKLALLMKKKSFSIFQLFGASLLGTLSPVCMFGTIPIVASFAQEDVPEYVIVSFMISSIMLNPNLLLVTFSLGTTLAFVRLFSAVVSGLLGGFLVYIFYKKEKFFHFRGIKKAENKKRK